MTKFKIKKGDKVKVISGSAKGKDGIVKSVNKETGRAVVEGLNMVSKHTKPSAKNPQGGIIQMESPIHISNLMLIDGSGKATRVGRKLDEKSNKLVRYSKKSGEVIK